MIIVESVVKASLIPGKGSSEEIGALPDMRKDFYTRGPEINKEELERSCCRYRFFIMMILEN